MQHHQSSLHDQSVATEASAMMMTGRNKFEDEPPSLTHKEATKTSLVLDMDELPQGYKNFETALIQSNNPGRRDAKDLLNFQIQKLPSEERRQESNYADETLDSKLTSAKGHIQKAEQRGTNGQHAVRHTLLKKDSNDGNLQVGNSQTEIMS